MYLLLLRLFSEDFPPDFGPWLQDFAPIHPEEHQRGPTLMLGDKTVAVPVHPKGAYWENNFFAAVWG